MTIDHEAVQAEAFEEFQSVQARLGRPHIESEAAVRDVVADGDEPTEAWERLASRGLIPLDWVDHPRRGFLLGLRAGLARGLVTSSTPTLRLPNGRRVVEFGAPPTTSTVRALAFDVAGVTAAEELAREYAARLTPFAPAGSLGAARVLWIDTSAIRRRSLFPPGDRLEVPGANVPGEIVARAAGGDSGYLAQCMSEIRIVAECEENCQVVGHAAFHAARWRAAARARLAVPAPNGPGTFHTLGDRTFDEVPSPFEPLLALWRTGYSIECVTAGAIVMSVRYRE